LETEEEVSLVISISKMTTTESQLQTLVCNTLALLGYTIIETGKARRKVQCPRCKSYHYPTGWQGNTVGCPDLYIHAAHWKSPVAVAVELKTTKGTVRKEQKCMAEQSMTAICRSVESVLLIVREYENLYGSPTQVERLDRYIERNVNLG
jgi:hypothetical protein